jgi:hypothetical protein
MTQDAMQEILDRVTYKPGVKLYLERDRYDVRVLRLGICTPVTDSEPEKYAETISLSYEIFPKYIENETQFLGTLQELITRWERHESAEWLRLDGVKVWHPHALL